MIHRKARAWAAAGAALTALAVVLAAGCVKVKDRMTLKPDGSGTVRIETETLMPAGMGGGGMDRMMLYPPANEEQARLLFPGDAFTLDVKPIEIGAGKPGFILEVAFKDINALVNSPYGRAHSLWIAREGGSLVLKARTGVQSMAGTEAAMANLPPEAREGGGAMQAKMVTDAVQKMAAEFVIVMPGAAKVLEGGATAQGNTVTWSVERAKFKGAAEAIKAFGEVLVARCPDAGVTFKPVPPLRLDLSVLKDLADAQIADAATVDVAKIRTAARFVPVLLQVTRSFDLAGESFRGENHASLSTLLVLPKEFKPAEWGQGKLVEARDDRGTDLLVKNRNDDDDEDMSTRYTSRYSRYSGDGDEPDAEAEAKRPNVVQPFVFALKVPPPAARKIALLKGTVEMRYGGPQNLVRVVNAIPKEAIVEMKAGPGMGEPPDGAPLVSPKLTELGVELMAGAARMNGMTMVTVRMGKGKAVLKDVQVFDAAGQPCSMMSTGNPMEQMMGGGGTSGQYMIVGAPEGPLSVAVILQTAGPAVTIPIELKDVPFTDNEAGKPLPAKEPAKGAAPGAAAPVPAKEPK